MKIDVNVLLHKLSSRKFWTMLAGLVGAILMVLNFDEGSIEQALGILTALGSVVTYILGESLVDFGRELNKTEASVSENPATEKESVE